MATTVPSGPTSVHPPLRRFTAIVASAVGVIGLSVAAVVVADRDGTGDRPARIGMERAEPAAVAPMQDPLIAQYGATATTMYDPLLAQYGAPEAAPPVDPLIAQYGRP